MNSIDIPTAKNIENRNPSAIASMVKCKCPRCRTGNMFVEKNPYKFGKIMTMKEDCDVCGQSFNIEVGFYYGSSYVSYALAIGLSVFFLIVYWFTVGLSIHDNRIIYWLVINAVLLIALQPILMRLARAIWLSIFVSYDKDWRINPAKKPERTNDTHKNNW